MWTNLIFFHKTVWKNYTRGCFDAEVASSAFALLALRRTYLHSWTHAPKPKLSSAKTTKLYASRTTFQHLWCIAWCARASNTTWTTLQNGTSVNHRKPKITCLIFRKCGDVGWCGVISKNFNSVMCRLLAYVVKKYLIYI